MFVLGIAFPSISLGLTIWVGGIVTQDLIESLAPYFPRPVNVARTSLLAKFWGTFRCQTYWLLATRGAWRVLLALGRTGRFEPAKTDRVAAEPSVRLGGRGDRRDRMTTPVTRRQYTYGLVATMAMLAGGCATMSPSEERRLGQEAAEEVEQTVGLVRDPKLVGYVRQVGGRLAQAAQRPDITWRFNVADDPEANAFALPGGWVYVTRGLLALLNSEDELAGVLGHEMAHVLERHAARRVSAATPFAVIFGVPAAILGTVSPTLGGIVSGTGRAASSVALASYSRDQEREADQRGVVLIARAGYDPTALAAFLRTLEREEALAGQNPDRARFLSSHPATPERVASVEAAARAADRARRGRRSPGAARPSWAGWKGW